MIYGLRRQILHFLGGGALGAIAGIVFRYHVLSGYILIGLLGGGLAAFIFIKETKDLKQGQDYNKTFLDAAVWLISFGLILYMVIQ